MSGLPPILGRESGSTPVDPATPFSRTAGQPSPVTPEERMDKVVLPVFAESLQTKKPSPSLASRCWTDLTHFLSAAYANISNFFQNLYKKIWGHQDAVRAKTLLSPDLHSLGHEKILSTKDPREPDVNREDSLDRIQTGVIDKTGKGEEGKSRNLEGAESSDDDEVFFDTQPLKSQITFEEEEAQEEGSVGSSDDDTSSGDDDGFAEIRPPPPDPPPRIAAVNDRPLAVAEVAPPYGIHNSENACYRIAAEQAIFACKPLLKAIRQPFDQNTFKRYSNETKEQFEERIAIASKALVQLQALMSHLEREDTTPEQIVQDERNLQNILFRDKKQSAVGAEKSDAATVVPASKVGMKNWLSWLLDVQDNVHQRLRAEEPLGILEAQFSHANRGKQMDTSEYLTLILGTLCDPKHVFDYLQRTRVSTETLANCESVEAIQKELQRASKAGTIYSSTASPEGGPSIYVPLGKPGSHLQQLIDLSCSPSVSGSKENPWRFDHKIVSTNQEGEEVVQTVTKSVDRFVEIPKYTGQPKDFLIMHFGRAVQHSPDGHSSPVDRRPITVPADGVIDFSLAYGLSKGELQYSATSFICHEGYYADAGHYTAYVKKEGQWFHCNDSHVKAVSDEKAMQKMMQEMGQAYMMFFEKI